MRPTVNSFVCAALCAGALLTSAAAAQSIPRAVPESPNQPSDDPQWGGGLDMDWFTIDGGGSTYLTGGAFQLGCTLGQPDAGKMTGNGFELSGGLWIAGPSCYANCDGSTVAPILNILDFQCFLNKYAANDPYANCDGSSNTPVLNVLDFICFQNNFAQGSSAANCDGSTADPILNVLDFVCFQNLYVQGCP
jgi:hypothetical protein